MEEAPTLHFAGINSTEAQFIWDYEEAIDGEWVGSGPEMSWIEWLGRTGNAALCCGNDDSVTLVHLRNQRIHKVVWPCESGGMAQTVSVIIGAEDRERLAAVVGDRNRPHKHVQRARIVLPPGSTRVPSASFNPTGG